MKPFLVSLTSDVDGIEQNYFRTIKNLKGSVNPIMVEFQPYPKEISGINTIKIDKPYVGNLCRFDYFPKGFNDDDIIIFTDTSDVIFQCPIPELRDKIHLSFEYDYWGDNNWWKEYLERFNFNELNGQPIYCMGTWAMSYKNVRSLLRFIKEHRNRFNDWSASDQILFNWWLKKKSNFKYANNPLLFGSIYDGYSKGKIFRTKNGFVNENKELISIIHANGNRKELLK
jgi:hypothetical protein